MNPLIPKSDLATIKLALSVAEWWFRMKVDSEQPDVLSQRYLSSLNEIKNMQTRLEAE